MDKVKINLFGESWSLKELELAKDLRAKMDSVITNSADELGNLLLDLGFYEEIDIPEIKSIADLPGTCVKGLVNSPKSQVEIWLNGKKILKIRLAELFHQSTLFKLYHTAETAVDFEEMAGGFYLFEKEIGLLACYQLTTPKFDINRLTFGLLKFEMDGRHTEILTEIFWENKLLISTKSDLVVRGSSCILKNS